MNPLLKMAVISGVNAAVSLHLRRGADPNSKDEKGISLLMHAAIKGHEETCLLLLEAGADPLILNNDSRDALALAKIHGHRDIERLLREHLNKFESIQTLAPFGREQGFIPDSDDSIDGNSIEEEESVNLSGWEEAIDSLPPLGDPTCLEGAETIQHHISLHVPIDADEDWSDIDFDLPQISIYRGKYFLDYDNWETERLLLLQGIKSGRLTHLQIERALKYQDERDLDARLRFLTVIEDLGIQIDEEDCLLEKKVLPQNLWVTDVAKET